MKQVTLLDRFALLGIPVLYFLTFAETAAEKFWGGMPDWFFEKFSPTFFATIPGGVSLSFYGIALAELTVTALALATVITLLMGKPRAEFLMKATVGVSAWTFAALSFGMRLTKDYSSAAQLFYFSAFSFVLYILLERYKPLRAGNQKEY